jgi:MFS family permease
MAFSTVPSPLYGLYRARDHFSLFMVTVVYAVYAIGVIGALLLAGHLSDWYGRRRLLLPALGIAIVSAIVFLASKTLSGLLVARLINGISIGIVPTTATAYLAELDAVGRPGATPGRAQLTASALNVGGLGIGAVAAGVLAQWAPQPLTLVYLVFLAALLLAAFGVALAPETREGPTPRPHYRAQRLSVPQDEKSRFFAATLSAFLAFAAIGLFTGLAGLFLSGTLHQPSHAVAGAVVGVMFAAGVAAQILTLFIAGGALIGAGGGAIFDRDGHGHRGTRSNRRIADRGLPVVVRGSIATGSRRWDNAGAPRHREGHDPRLRDRRQRRHRHIRDQARGPNDGSRLRTE